MNRGAWQATIHGVTRESDMTERLNWTRFVIASLPRSKHLLISWLQSVCSDFGAPQNKICHCFPFFPIYLPWSDVMRCHDFSFLNFEFQVFHSSCNFIKMLFNSSLLSAIRVVSSAYLRLLIFLMAILIPACASSRPALCMIYSAYKLNKQGDNIQPWGTLFWLLNQSIVPCPVLLIENEFLFNILKIIHLWQV